MNVSYNEFLERLKAERLRCQLTQKEMSGKLKVVQNHYSKIECGRKRLSFYEMNNLCKTKLDVYYIFTGNRCENKSMENLGRRHFVYCLKIINLLAYNHSRSAEKNREQWRTIYRLTKYINYIDEASEHKKNIFRAARNHFGCTQVEMAQCLGVDVKKLRDLECGRVLPDSELMFNMYKYYGVSPSVFLKDIRCAQSEISYLIETSAQEVGDALNECIVFVREHW